MSGNGSSGSSGESAPRARHGRSDGTADGDAAESGKWDRRYLAGLFELHGVVLFELNDRGEFVRLGPAWGAFSGYSRSEALGRELVEFVRAEQKAVVASRIRDVFDRARAGLTFDFDFRRPEGHKRWVQLQLLALSEDGSRVIGAMSDTSSGAAVGTAPAPGHDHLTGLADRHLFLDRLESLVAEARRTGSVLALLSIDLDGFRKVNDTLGHSVADELLKAIAQRLARLVRNDDLVARVGSDEFVVVQVGISRPDDAMQLAQRLIRTIKQRFVLLDRDVHTSGSVGVALFPWDASTPGDLLRKAGIALAESKSGGGGTGRFFDAEVEARLARSRRIEEQLFKGFELRQFEVHFQPCVDLRSEAIVGAEALVRWRHPEDGLVPPAEFMPVAESCGFIRLLGPWVLRTACRALRRWEERKLPPIVLAVNVSAVQFANGAVRDVVESSLAEFGVDPGRLELELTETAVLDGGSRALREQLSDLSRMGVRIAIDDFGTGYGSLTHLRELPLTKIKIDRRFIHRATANPDDAAIVRAVGALGVDLGMSVHAEGIETAAQHAMARDAGCTEGQGFHFSPPLPECEFERLLDQAGR